MKYYIIAGEKSGDLHASNLIKALKQHDTQGQFRCWGGEETQKAGGELVHHYKEMAFMGLWEVVKNLPTVWRFLKECKKDILNYRPDVVILIDYAGFNMQISKFCKKNNIKNFYYISPKVWAWRTHRALNIKATVDKMFVIFPFEKNFYKKFNYEVDYVGNPLLDAIGQYEPNYNFLTDNKLNTQKPIIAVLPGSRKQEIDNMLAVMLSLPAQMPDYEFVVAGVSHLPSALYEACRQANIQVIYDQTYDLLTHAHAAIVTSGTATLETALLNTPQVVCYKAHWISYEIVKRLIQVNYISLVNLVADKGVVKELIQNDLTTQNLKKELLAICEGGEKRNQVLQGYAEIQKILDKPNASDNVAQLILKNL
jgi:lipid-A-disaccharide synthase